MTHSHSHPHQKLIDLRNVTIGWDRRVVLSDVSFSVDRGDFIAITGPNGGGKTTLLRIILKLLKPSKGSVDYLDGEGNTVRHLPIGYLPQKNMIDSHFPISVHQVIASGLLASHNLSADEKTKRIAETIELMGLVEKANQPIGELSGGQLQRALLGRAIISRPEVLVLDEPLSYIDKRFESRLYEIIEQLARHTTILLVSHEMSTIAAMATRHFIVDGRIHECSATHHYVRSECDE